MQDRVITVNLLGHEYPMCLTVDAQSTITQLCGGLEEIGSLFDETDMPGTLTNIVQLLHILLQGGREHARVRDLLDGTDSSKHLVALSADDLRAVLSLSDIPLFQSAIFEAIKAGLSSTVEVEPPKGKKEKATQRP